MTFDGAKKGWQNFGKRKTDSFFEKFFEALKLMRDQTRFGCKHVVTIPNCLDPNCVFNSVQQDAMDAFASDGWIASCVRAVAMAGLAEPIQNCVVSVGVVSNDDRLELENDVPTLFENIVNWRNGVVSDVETWEADEKRRVRVTERVLRYCGEIALDYERNPLDSVLLLWERNLAFLGENDGDVKKEAICLFFIMHILSIAPYLIVRLCQKEDDGGGIDCSISVRLHEMLSPAIDQTFTLVENSTLSELEMEERFPGVHYSHYKCLQQVRDLKREIRSDIESLLVEISGTISPPNTKNEIAVAQRLVGTGNWKIERCLEFQHLSDELEDELLDFSEQAINASKTRTYGVLIVLVALVDILTPDFERKRARE